MASDKPNILFIFADQMRAMDMGCAGNGQVRTPTMDRLASQGVRLTHHFATNPVCGPNRATLLTGTYATTHRVVGNDLAVRTDLPSLGTVAKAQGYRTAYIGKWHLDGVPRSKFTPPGERRLGFDYWAVYNCTHDYFHPRYYRDDPQVIERDGYEPAVQTDLALDYLDAHGLDAQPFCLVLSWGPPHDPYPTVPQRYRDLYDPATIELRPNAQPKAANPLAQGKDCRRTIADYYAAITALDDQLGRLLDKLEALDIARNTLVVFTSDHGDMLWSHGWMKKQLPFEESIAVPLIARWPGRLPAGDLCGTLIGTVDLLPTLGGLSGWTMPGTVEGLDRSRAMREPGAHDDQAASVFLANYSNADEGQSQGAPVWRGVRTRRHTYIETTDGPWLLFDNQADPYQMRNLVGCERAAEVQRELSGILRQWLERTGDSMQGQEQVLAAMGLTEAWEERERIMHP